MASRRSIIVLLFCNIIDMSLKQFKANMLEVQYNLQTVHIGLSEKFVPQKI